MVAIPARPHQRQPLQHMANDAPRASGRAIMAKKKVYQASQASMALLNPAYAMGVEMEHSWSDSSSISSSSKQSQSKSHHQSPSSSRHASQPSNASSSSSSRGGYIEDPTPELEAFTMQDFSAAALVRHRTGRNDDGDDDDYADEWSTSPSHRKNATMGSFFEDDADAASPKLSTGRKVAFRVRGGSQDATKEMMAARQGGSGGKAASNYGSSASSPLARLFGWKRGNKKNNGQASPSSDVFDSQPMSAPAHITTFDRSMPPLSDSASSTAGSLPPTPIGGAVMTLPGGSPIMPHRKGGPPPRGILRKQSAPMLRAASEDVARAPSPQPELEEPMIMLPPRSAEAPPSLPSMHFAPLRSKASDSSLRKVGGRQGPPSPLWTPSNVTRSSSTDSQSSFTERRYSTVGRGVARNRSDASLTSSASSHSLALSSNSSIRRKPVDATPSPARRKPVNRRFEGMPESPSVIDWQKLSASPSPQNQPLRVVGASLFSLPSEVSMAQKVANGELSKGRGHEEPMPRSTSKDSNLTVSSGASQRSARRRSRSVGAMDVPAFVVPSLTVEAPAPAKAPAAVFPADGFFAPQTSRSQQRTPTQQSVSAFAASPSRKPVPKMIPDPAPIPATGLSPRGHKSEFSVDSVSSASDSGDSEEAPLTETVQAARRVQLVGTRAKATALSSPSMRSSPSGFSLRSPLLKASPIPTVNILPPSSPSVKSPLSSPQAQPETPANASKAATAAASVATPPSKKASVRSPPGSAESLVADLSEEEIRRRWSRRDSCILALSLAHCSVDGIDEEDEEEERLSEAAQAEPVLAKMSSPSVDMASLHSLESTAPLNIKPRNKRSPAVTPTSSENSLPQTESFGHPSASGSANTLSSKGSSAFESLFSTSLGSLINNEEAMANLGNYEDSHIPARPTHAAPAAPRVAPPAAVPQLVAFGPSQDSLGTAATAASMPSLDSSASGSSSMASTSDNIAEAAQPARNVAATPSPRLDANNSLGVTLLGMTSSDSHGSMATTVRTSIFELGGPYENEEQMEVEEQPRKYTHRAQLSEGAFEDPSLTPTSFNDGSFGDKKKKDRALSPRLEINVSEHDTDDGGESPGLAYTQQFGPVGHYAGGRLSPSVHSRASRSPSPAASTRTVRGAGHRSPTPSTRSVTPTQESTSTPPAPVAPVSGLGLGLDLGPQARVMQPASTPIKAAYGGSVPEMGQYHDYHAHQAFNFGQEQVAEMGVGEWQQSEGGAYYPQYSQQHGTYGARKAVHDDAYLCDYSHSAPEGVRAGGSGEWEMGVAL
ncbi:hypothetical protein BDZ90DRAFT_131400 [Jaminaea rosea]|uniref:Uncharacterized protein n=1 Tax=Jaminaea rosea TaxID=1569628 RepID=A0A316UWV9_9BASI|nr:hypothetical protein BDZ90DRAFT_131400 [Jaminaea rosea]PWN28811.1 hypothetical protein BDZ90DRAFT_131400 [Jaminaea rosea]